MERLLKAIILIHAWLGLRKRPQNPANSILIVAPLYLGDLFMLAPFIRGLREQEPSSNIILICRAGLKETANTLPVDQVIEANKPTRRNRREIKLAALDGYKTCYCIFAGAWLPTLSTISIKTLISHAEPKGRFPHLIDKHLSIPECSNSIPEMIFSASGVKAQSSNAIPMDNWKPRGDFAIIHLGARSPARHLSPNQIATLAHHISGIIHGPILLTGGEKEGPSIQDIFACANELRRRIKDLRGKTTLSSLRTLISSAKALVSVDTGIAHFSKALGTPTFVLFGQSQPGVFGKDNLYSRSRHFGVDNLDCRDKHTLHGHPIDWISTCNKNSCPIPGRPCLPDTLPPAAIESLKTLFQEASAT